MVLRATTLTPYSPRITEIGGVAVTSDLKPIPGDWNGAGAHTNYSTESMRKDGGFEVIVDAVKKLKLRHKEHITAYGEGNERRLTGNHETADIHTFIWVSPTMELRSGSAARRSRIASATSGMAERWRTVWEPRRRWRTMTGGREKWPSELSNQLILQFVFLALGGVTVFQSPHVPWNEEHIPRRGLRNAEPHLEIHLCRRWLPQVYED